MWQGMVAEQKLKLEPFGIRHVIAGLLRCKEGWSVSRVDDAAVMRKLDILKDNDPKEYAALEELAHTLGGLPLALTQAGFYISWKGTSFANYVALYRKCVRVVEYLSCFANSRVQSCATSRELSGQPGILTSND